MKELILKIPDWQYERLLRKIDSLKKAMYLFKINEDFKRTYLDDIASIEVILNKHGGKENEHKRHHDQGHISSNV